jgi:Sjoegren syndrome nuclear autoantigen 1
MADAPADAPAPSRGGTKFQNFDVAFEVSAEQAPQFAELDIVMGKLAKKIDVLKWKMNSNQDRKEVLITKIEMATERHKRVKTRLERRLAAKAEYEKTIAATDSAYNKILLSSSTLLSVLQENVGNDPEEDIPDPSAVNSMNGSAKQGIIVKDSGE